MSIIDKAARVIADHNADGVCNEPECIAGDLARAGLLAPNLPEPDLDHRDPEHRAEYKTLWEGPVPNMWYEGLPDYLTVQTFPDNPDVQMNDNGVPMEPFSPEEARRLAYALLAAADHAEEEV